MQYGEDADAKWITIHPGDSEKGQHVMVDGDGKVVGGNPHLVTALNAKHNHGNGEGGLSENTEPENANQNGGGDPFGDFEGFTFAPPEDDEFEGLVMSQSWGWNSRVLGSAA